MKRFHIILVIVSVAVLSACGGTVDLDRESVPFDVPEDADISTTENGVTVITLEEGTGTNPVVGDTVVVDYTGRLEDGTEFDSSREEGREPFEFQLGFGQVIQGWDEAVNAMPVGTRAILVIPPGLGYGEQGSPPTIPPNATLYFDIEVLEVRR